MNKTLQQFNKEYNTDGSGKALVILEDNESGTMTQRPAQKEIKQTILKALKDQKEDLINKINSELIAHQDEDIRPFTRREQDYIKGYNQCKKDILKEIKGN